MSTPTAPQRRPAYDAAAPAAPTPIADRTLESNAYAISYRLLGDRPSAAAVAGIAAQRLRSSGLVGGPDWLYHLVHFTLQQTVDPRVPVHPAHDDAAAGLRQALRRRLVRATPDERVAAALYHLAGYPSEFVASVLGGSPARAVELAGVIAPPPGVDYRQLGDPQLTHAEPVHGPGRAPARRWRPRASTVLVAALVLAAVLWATQITGPRPTLGPPLQDAPAATADVPGG